MGARRHEASASTSKDVPPLTLMCLHDSNDGLNDAKGENRTTVFRQLRKASQTLASGPNGEGRRLVAAERITHSFADALFSHPPAIGVWVLRRSDDAVSCFVASGAKPSPEGPRTRTRA